MKRIMVISEHDHGEVGLARLAENLFTHEKRKLFVCNVEFVDCRVGSCGYHLPKALVGTTANSAAVSVYPDYLPVCVERLEAHSCKELISKIKEYHIDTVVLPIFLHNEGEWGYYRHIASILKRMGEITVLGMVVD